MIFPSIELRKTCTINQKGLALNSYNNYKLIWLIRIHIGLRWSGRTIDKKMTVRWEFDKSKLRDVRAGIAFSNWINAWSIETDWNLGCFWPSYIRFDWIFFRPSNQVCVGHGLGWKIIQYVPLWRTSSLQIELSARSCLRQHRPSLHPTNIKLIKN